jgi:hypothetical protein
MKLTKAQEDALAMIRSSGGSLVMGKGGKWIGPGVNWTTLKSLVKMGVIVPPEGWQANVATVGEYRLAGEFTERKTPAQLRREIREILDEIPEGHKITIVTAWTEDTQEIAPGQKPWRHDLGERPRFVDTKKAHAAMWLNQGTRSDLDKANAWVTREYPDSGHAFAYPTTESDPLGRARREILSRQRAGSRR